MNRPRARSSLQLRFVATLVASAFIASPSDSQGRIRLRPATPIIPAGVGAGDFYGSAMAAGEELFLVASERGVYLHERTSFGGVEVGLLQPPGISTPPGYGDSIAISGPTFAVGSPLEGSSSGAAYVYERDPTTALGARLVARPAPPGLAPGDRFGEAVALSGDTLFVGAPGRAAGGPGAGVVFVFERDLGGVNAWGERQRLSSPFASESFRFGRALAAQEATLVVGTQIFAPQPIGSSLIFAPNSDPPHDWVLSASLPPSGAVGFGSSVAIAGDTVAVVDLDQSVFPRTNGSVTLFERGSQPGEWIEVAHLAPPAAGAFGAGIHLHGARLAVGAPGDGVYPEQAFLYQRTRAAVGVSTWRQLARLKPRFCAPGAPPSFGEATLVDAYGALIGAPTHSGTTGSVCVFVQAQGPPPRGTPVPAGGDALVR